MTDRTRYDIDFLNDQNKDRTYQEKKKANKRTEQIMKKVRNK
jgi:hypothetical protein